MNAKNINSKLDELFKEWLAHYPESQRYLFCQDGLMLKADGGADVNELWQNAKRRVMFILKDNPDGWGHDTRRWLVNDSEEDVSKKRFLLTLAEILYVLVNLDSTEESRKRLSYNRVHNALRSEVVDGFLRTIPFAFVEAKKLAGGDTVLKSQMTEALTSDSDFLKREIDIIRPNIIVCCDRYNSQFNYLTRNYFAGKEAQVIEYDYTDETGKKLIGQRCCLWYYPSEKVVVIKSYHPSYGALWKTFERVISVFHAFLKKHPEVNF